MFRRLALFSLAALGLAGCQTYARRPLDLARHRSAWEARDPASAGVAGYARRLAGLGHTQPTPFDPADGLSLAEAELVALFFNPQLRVARLRARVPLAGAREAGRWEDPELAIDAERIIRSVDEPWVLGGMLNLTIPLSGRPGAEREQAFAQADVERLRALVEEARVLTELHAAWLQLAAVDQRVALVTQFLNDLGPVVERADRLSRAGELDPVEARLFRIEQLRRSAELRRLGLERRQRELAVRALLGLAPTAAVSLAPSLPGAAEQVAPSKRRRRVEEDHPRMRLARAEYEAAERSLNLEVRRLYPDLNVGGGFGTEEGEERLLAGLSLPLPLLNANRRAIAEARTGRDAARAEAEGRYEELVAALAAAEAALEAAQAQRQFVEKELAPLVDEQLEAARRLERLGDVNTLILLESLTRAHEARLEVLDSVVKEGEAVNDLNALLRPGATVGPEPEARK